MVLAFRRRGLVIPICLYLLVGRSMKSWITINCPLKAARGKFRAITYSMWFRILKSQTFPSMIKQLFGYAMKLLGTLVIVLANAFLALFCLFLAF